MNIANPKAELNDVITKFGSNSLETKIIKIAFIIIINKPKVNIIGIILINIKIGFINL